MKKLIFCLLIFVILFGCSFNIANKDSKIIIIIGNMQDIWKKFPQLDHPGAVTTWNESSMTIYLPDDCTIKDTYRLSIHELLKHALPAKYPETRSACDKMLLDIQSKDFDVITCAKPK